MYRQRTSPLNLLCYTADYHLKKKMPTKNTAVMNTKNTAKCAKKLLKENSEKIFALNTFSAPHSKNT